jgi:predicted transcriptional regulator
MTRRSQMEIYIDILKAVVDGKRRPTHIMYRANLSWTRLKKYLDFLMGQALLEETLDDGATIFSITPKGKDVLGYFKGIESVLYNTNRVIPSEVYVQYK